MIFIFLLQYKLIYQYTCYIQRMNADVVKTSLAVKSKNHSPRVGIVHSTLYIVHRADRGRVFPSSGCDWSVQKGEAVIERRCSIAPGMICRNREVLTRLGHNPALNRPDSQVHLLVFYRIFVDLVEFGHCPLVWILGVVLL